MAGASTPMKLRTLPIIDITPFLHAEDEHFRGHSGGRAATAAALHAACLTYGFFYLDISNYAPEAEMVELAELGRKFFALEEGVKERWGLDKEDGARGYQRLKENITNGKADNHEGFDFYAPVASPDKSKPLWGSNQWPDESVAPGFREKFEKWIEKMKKLGMIVMEAMALGLGMSDEEWQDLRSKVDDSFWVMRIIGYPPLPNDYDGFSCGAHKDYGCLTFLYADPTPNALQVFLTKDGDLLNDTGLAPIPANATAGLAPSAASGVQLDTVVHDNDGFNSVSETAVDGDKENSNAKSVEEGVWITADPIPGCIVCNIGEMWEIWTNGLYKSTLHRVMHRGSNYRVSIPFFFEPNFNAHVAPLRAALRLQEGTVQPAYNANGVQKNVHGDNETLADGSADGAQGAVQRKVYQPVVYGEFLTKKVANNFAGGKGKYD